MARTFITLLPPSQWVGGSCKQNSQDNSTANHQLSQFYQNSVKTATGFSPFQLVYSLEAVLPIECQIPSLKLAVQLLPDTSPLEEQLVHLEQLDEQHCDAALAKEAHKHKFKCQYDRFVHPRVFSEGDLVLVYDQDKDPLGARNFKPMWFGPFIIKEVLKKGAYRLVNFEGNAFCGA
jgi:hypothetical protein